VIRVFSFPIWNNNIGQKDRNPNGDQADAAYAAKENYAYLEKNQMKKLPQIQQLLSGNSSTSQTRTHPRTQFPL